MSIFDVKSKKVAVAGKITKKLIAEGIENELVNVIANPNSLFHIYEIGCKIGSYWFPIDDKEADSITKFYLRNTKKSIINKIYEAISQFKENGEAGITEYNYYYFYLTDYLGAIKALDKSGG